MSIHDPKFKYRGQATHADPSAFARRMKARARIAKRQRELAETKVTAIRRPRAKEAA